MRILLALLVVISSGCSAYVMRSGVIINPAKETVSRSETYNKAFNDIWQAVLNACKEADVLIKVIEEENGIVTAEGSIAATEELSKTFETSQKIVLTYDKMRPVKFFGSANTGYVARTGKVVDRNVIELDLLSELKRQSAFVVLSYNIHVEKMDNNETKVSINIFASPAQPKIMCLGDQIHFNMFITQQLMFQKVEIDISEAKFLSKGTLEDNFLMLIKKLITKG